MIIMHESIASEKMNKPMICPKCKRGTLGHIPEESETVISRRGKPPPNERREYVQVKCYICRSHWKLIMKNK